MDVEMELNAILKKHHKHRDSILEILHDIQNNDPKNYLSEDSLKKVAKHFNLPLAQVYGIVGYYSMFSLKPRGRFVIQICKSPICGMMGSQSIYDALKQKIDSLTHNSSLFSIEKVECLGQCSQSPCMMVNNAVHGQLTTDKVETIIDELVLSVQNTHQ